MSTAQPGPCLRPEKRRYPTRALALAAMTDLRRDTHHRDLSVYRCPVAGPEHWHVGHSRVLLTGRIRRALRKGTP